MLFPPELPEPPFFLCAALPISFCVKLIAAAPPANDPREPAELALSNPKNFLNIFSDCEINANTIIAYIGFSADKSTTAEPANTV